MAGAFCRLLTPSVATRRLVSFVKVSALRLHVACKNSGGWGFRRASVALRAKVLSRREAAPSAVMRSGAGRAAGAPVGGAERSGA